MKTTFWLVLLLSYAAIVIGAWVAHANGAVAFEVPAAVTFAAAVVLLGGVFTLRD